MFILTTAAEYWRGLSRTVKIIGYVGVVSGAIVSAATAFPIVEPWIVAHRGYVRSENTPLLHRVIEIQLQANENRRERLINDMKRYETELQSDQVKQLPQYRDLVQQQVERASQEIRTIDEQNKSLFREKLSR